MCVLLYPFQRWDEAESLWTILYTTVHDWEWGFRRELVDRAALWIWGRGWLSRPGGWMRLWESLPEALSPCGLHHFCCLLGSGDLRLAGTQIKKGGSKTQHWELPKPLWFWLPQGWEGLNLEVKGLMSASKSPYISSPHFRLPNRDKSEQMPLLAAVMENLLSWEGQFSLSHTGRTQNEPHRVARCYGHTVIKRDRKN